MVGAGCWGSIWSGLSPVRGSGADLRFQPAQTGQLWQIIRCVCGPSMPRFGNPSIEAVVIATPAETHYEMTKQALRAGKMF